jgi:uncharacterized membrane protein (GlpM family)
MTTSPMTHLRRWWPVPVLLTFAIVVQELTIGSRYDISGHAAGHLGSASVAFPAFALVAILLYFTPRARTQALVLVTSTCWLLSTVLMLVGNIRVVDALIDAGMANTPTSQLVQNPTVEAAHGLANIAPYLGVVTAVALVGALWLHGHISRRVAIGAGVLCVIFPPWIFPGAGVLVIVIARGVAFARATPTDEVVPTAVLVSMAGRRDPNAV